MKGKIRLMEKFHKKLRVKGCLVEMKGKNGIGWIVVFCIILMFEAIFVFSGCGGGGGSAFTGGGGSGATGNVSVNINWPSGSGGSKLDLGKSTVLKTIPEDTSYVTVEIVNPSTYNSLVPSVRVNRTPGVSNNSVTIDNIPLGNVQVRVSAYDSGDNCVAYGYTSTNVISGNNPAVAVTLTPGATPPTTPPVSPTESPTIWAYVMSKYPHPDPSSTVMDTPGVEVNLFAPTPLASGTYTVSKDGGSPAALTPKMTPPANHVSQTYYYGSQPSSVSGPIDLPLPNAVNESWNINLPFTGGSELGTYQINVNGNPVSVTQNLSVPSQLSITSPASGTSFDPALPLTVTWTSLGSNFVYYVHASKPPKQSGDVADLYYFWTNADVRSTNFTNPYTWSSFFMGLSSNNSTTIPANIFGQGETVEIEVMAFNKNYTITPSYPVGVVKAAHADARIIIYTSGGG